MDHTKHWLDAASIGAAFASFIGWLPSMAAFLSVVWTIIRIYETKTVQSWIERRKK